jgi:hypothetical protein
MKDMRWIRVLAAPALALLASSAMCTRPGPLNIWRLRGDTLVKAADSAEYECRAWTPGRGGIIYHWEASRGELAWDYTDTDSLLVRVSPVTRTVLDYDGGVKAQYYREWRDSLRAGYLLEGDFSVDTNTVSFFVLDSTDRARWVRNDSFQGLVSVRLAEADSFEVVVQNTGWYSMIIDNRYGKIDDVQVAPLNPVNEGGGSALHRVRARLVIRLV